MSEDEKFMKIADEYFYELYKASPVSATRIGVHEYDGVLDDVSADAMRKNREGLSRIKEKLAAIEMAKLSRAMSVDYRILNENIDEALWGYDELREYEWNPLMYTGLVGNSIMLLITQDFAPLESRLRSALARTRQIPGFLNNARANLKNAPRVHVETAVLQNKGNVSIFETEFPRAADSASEDLRQQIKAACADAKTALESFGTWLEKDLMAGATRDPRIGRETYFKKLRYALKSDIDPADILARAETEKRKTHAEMYELAAPLYKKYYRMTPKGKDSLEVVRAVLTRVVLDHPKREELMDYIKGILPQLARFIKSKDLLTLDDSKPLVIRETPEFQRGVTVASLESPGPLEKNLKTFYNVSPIPGDWTAEQIESYLREYNNYSLHNLSIHEGIPGHYVQLYYANRDPSLIRSVLGSGSMIEGWAVYAERMMVDNGYMDDDPRMKLINLKWYIRVVINAIIDHRIHAGSMTEQEAMDLMMREGFQEEREAAGKWKRANLTSAQLSTYFVGYQEIVDLKKAYQQKMGGRFSLKEFHETFLSFGSPSVKYIREFMIRG
jgi:uncharacterized protein (DUF885 family)